MFLGICFFLQPTLQSRLLDRDWETEKSVTELLEKLVELNEAAVKTDESIEEVGKASKTAEKGVKGIGISMKALGIGAIIGAFTKLSEIFSRNQKAADFFSTVLNAVSLVINDLINIIVDNVQPVAKSFKAFFDDPLQGIKNLESAIRLGLIARFNELLEVLGDVGSAFVSFFKGDFSGALEDITNAGKGLADVFSGVDGTFDKTYDTLKEYFDRDWETCN